MKKDLFSNKWKVTSIVLAVLSIVLAVFVFQSMSLFSSPQKIGEQAIEFINDNLLGEGTVATLGDIKKSDIEGLYNMGINIQEQTFESFVSLDGKYLFVDGPIDTSVEIVGQSQEDLPEMAQKESVISAGGFSEILDMDVCMENDKPIVYFFGSESCPHCSWERLLIDEVASEFGDAIDYRLRYDGNEDIDVLLKYGTGAVPTLIIGCKYYRIGSGENSGEEVEKEALKTLMCDATGGVPSSICL